MRRCLTPPVGPAADLAARLAASVPVLETERLVLRSPSLCDFESWCAAWQPFSAKRSAESQWREFCVYVAGWQLHGQGLWTVHLRASDEVVGFVFLGLDWGDAEPELGWATLPTHRRSGYAREAAAAVQAHAEHLHGAGGAVSYIALDNAASAATAASVGAQRDAATEAAYDHETQVWRHGVPA